VSPVQRASWVVVPALNEVHHIQACINALEVAAFGATASVHVIVVDDGSTDGTGEVAQSALRRWGHGHAVLVGSQRGVGWARRVGFEHALAKAAPQDLIATTDADSRVDPVWLRAMHALLDDGAPVIAGDVDLDATATRPLVRARQARLRARLRAVRATDPTATHPHFAGANLGFAASALRRLGPLPVVTSLEDEALADRCTALGIPILRHAAPRVVTSPRTAGRAPGGLSVALARDARLLGGQ
jgi:GT2 family glycosyltransferase